MSDDAALIATLSEVRERGAIGERSLVDAVAHADRFAALVPADASSLADLGSGGGLPGLVIAWRHPTLAITLIERRGARADLLRRSISALGLDRVSVAEGDVRLVIASDARFDVVTARSFGPLTHTVDVAIHLLHQSGLILISEPPVRSTSASLAAQLRDARLDDIGVIDGVRVLRR